MHHLLAYASTAATAAATDFDLPGIADPAYTRQNNHFVLGRDMSLLGAFAHGADLLRARIVTSDFRNFGAFDIFPFEAAAVPPDDFRWMKLMEPYPILEGSEEIEVRTTNDAAADQDEVVGIWIADQGFSKTLPSGRRFRARFTTTNTLTAFTWSAESAIAFTQALKTGRYAVVGCMVQSADCSLIRLVFDGQVHRPGSPIISSLDNVPNLDFLGGLGVWGTFNTFSPPQLQGLGVAAGAENMIGFMDLVYLGRQTGLP